MSLTQVPSGMLQTTAQYYAFKNRIINGAGLISQYNGANAVTNSGGATYFVDRWNVYDGSGGSHFSLGQNLGGVTPPSGFQTYIGVKTTSAVSASAGNNFSLNQYIEGYNINDLNWGTANAQTVTASFWVYSSLTGTFCGEMQSDNANAYYTYTFNIPVANTWTYITVTVPGPTIGTWNANSNNRGICFRWDLGYGSNFAGTAGVWSSSTVLTVTGAQKVVGTLNATFYVTGVQLEVGTQATSFDYRPYGTELALCQRYFYASPASTDAYIGSGFGAGASAVYAGGTWPVTMRASATVSYQGSFTGTVVTTAGIGGSLTGIGSPVGSTNSWYSAVGGSGTYPTYAYVQIRGSTSFQLTASAEL